MICAAVMGEPLDECDAQQLLARARRGDREAYESLFAREVTLLQRWASGRLPRWARDAADTSDLVQETVLNTLKRLDGFEPQSPGALQAYMRQALFNRVRNALRGATRRPGVAELDPQMPATGVSPLEAAIGQQALRRYEMALSRLTTDDRDAVVARVEMQLTFAEIATMLHKPTPDAARMAVVRALSRLAREMETLSEEP